MSLLFLAAASLSLVQSAEANRYFRITVVDEQTGRGVPLVELRTVHGVRYWTDSNGIVAFHEPGLMDRDVFFFVSSHGYEFPKDGFGFRGRMLRVTAGGSAKLTIRRLNIAERLYRITGAGIYRDSFLAGAEVPLKEPLLNGLVLGSDSVHTAIYRGKLYWFWGDTNKPSYPLGNFHVPGAVSELPGPGGLDPQRGIDLRYFLDEKGFAKPTARMPGKGPTWLTALAALPDVQGRERLFASYVKVEAPMTIYARGLMVFNDERNEFEHLAAVDMKSPIFPAGHTFRHRENGVEYLYFGNPFPLTRVRATADHFQKIGEYENYTCLKEGTSLKEPQLDRDADGKLHYAWRKNAPALGPSEERKLLQAGRLKPGETRWQLRDRDTGKMVLAHGGSVYWNAFRRRWVLIAVESMGTSFLGEVWYAEADTPVGPWNCAVKVVTHERYSFYNPKHHPAFDQDGGRYIFFEGTYTHTFSGNPNPTPRYDYNQIMYRLDLADPRLVLPVAIYDLPTGDVPTRFGPITAVQKGTPRLAFFAPDRPLKGTIPVLADEGGLRLGKEGDQGAVFYALPPEASNPPPHTTPLYEYRQKDGTGRAWSINDALPGYERLPRPLCLVWGNGVKREKGE